MSDPSTHRVAHNGVEIVATDQGSGDPVVVLHGFTGDASTMNAAVQPLVVGGRRVVAIDLIGHGRSASPADPAAYSMASCVAQVVAVCESLGIDLYDVVGYSMGARTALSLAVAHPDRVRRLALIGGTAGLEGIAEREARIAADAAIVDQLRTAPLRDFVDMWMSKPIFATQEGMPAAARDAARTQRLGNNPVGLANSLVGMGTGAMAPLHAHLGAVTTPVLVIVGELDQKFAAIGMDLVARLPNGQFCAVADAGHATHLEQPDATASEILTFFGAATP